MTVKMTPADWRAKGDAYEEASDHLCLSWTEDDRERFQGSMVAAELRRKAEHCWRLAADPTPSR